MNHLSPSDLQNIMKAYKAWVDNLGSQYLGGQRLEENGAQIDGADVVTDGPFLASKEIIAGYMIIAAPDQDEANKIASSLPHVGLYRIEVRPIAYPKMK